MTLIKKSEKVLKSLQLENGGILATPKDGAYPYVYPRDAVIMTKAMNSLNNTKFSEKFYHFINKFSKFEQYNEIFQRYNKKGLPYVTRKNEHDNTGLIIHGIYDTYMHNKNETFLENMFPLIENCVNAIKSFITTKGLVKTETSIHEFYRLEHGYEIWANSACCRGLLDAVKIAEILEYDCKDKWKKKAEKLKKNILKKMFNKKKNIFMKNLRFPKVVDISQLSPFYFNLTNNKRHLKNTLKILEKHIWHQEHGGFRRFKKFEVCKDWHWYTGGSGSWTFGTLWAARFYKYLKDKKNENRCRKWIEDIAKKTNNLVPEHIATEEEYDIWKMHEIEFSNRIMGAIKKAEKLSKTKTKDLIYWATPLGWSHAEYILLKKRKCL